ncbi:type II toxin-antitoxin system prevent-host-death family antitoxin [Nocardiopsis sp. HNM0947]|uniref:Antitoxin n=1 Tax=Nocardiopsis coralli TaxID=2772213 RepID=A0ABR9PAU8_9ACTN|nr:type II toxin-antitoxin system prevent-host-death family antitoxin [Nocardiopsis coralli]MBE3000953.1 type II toxin-antitoxin system prevent-host-death family antitoxin [Nocardiopsis coralli]
MRRITAAEAAVTLPQLLDSAERGESVLITRAGRPVAVLKPHRGSRAGASGAGLRAAIEKLEPKEGRLGGR